MSPRDLAIVRIMQHYGWVVQHSVDAGGGFWNAECGDEWVQHFSLEELFSAWLEKPSVLLAVCGVKTHEFAHLDHEGSTGHH